MTQELKWRCANCLHLNPPDVSTCSRCYTPRSVSQPAPSAAPASEADDEEVDEEVDEEDDEEVGREATLCELLQERYGGAYATAEATIARGKTLQGLAIGVGIVILLGGALLGGQIDSELAGILLGLVFALVAGGSLYTAGLQLVTQGQLMLAALDTAVNTSPLLSEEEKMAVMQLGL